MPHILDPSLTQFVGIQLQELIYFIISLLNLQNLVMSYKNAISLCLLTWMINIQCTLDPSLPLTKVTKMHYLAHMLPTTPTAPKLQGRPRKKRKKPTDSESESSETSEDIRPRLKGKPGLTAKPNGLRVLDRKSSSRAHLAPVKNDFTPALNRLIEVDFMSKLNKFMKDRGTPITRLPHIGYKQCK